MKMNVKHVLSLFVIVLIVALSGCKSEQPAPQPVQQAPEPVVQPQPVQQAPPNVTEEPKANSAEQLQNVKESSNGEGYCGDGICQNVEHQYPNSQVLCEQTGCALEGKRTENNYNCPGDCGMTCDERTVIGVKPGTCTLKSNGDIEFTIVNSGYSTIDGFLFYIAEKPMSEKGEVGYDTAEKGLDSKQVAVENVKYDILARTSGQYTVDVSKWKQKFGSVDHIEIMPRVISNGQTKECSNQKVLVPLRTCK